MTPRTERVIFIAHGVIMLAAMPVLIGLQLLPAFLAYDIASVPRHALGRLRR